MAAIDHKETSCALAHSCILLQAVTRKQSVGDKKPLQSVTIWLGLTLDLT